MVDKIILENIVSDELTIDLSDYLVCPEIEIPKPTPILSVIQDGRLVDIFTEENISMIQGQAKAKKSFFIKSICEGILKGNNKLSSNYYRNDIAIIDTEQSTYHCYMAVKSVKYMTGKTISYFSVAELDSKQKMSLVEKFLKVSPNCGFLILDNIVHFLNNFNDVEESSLVTQWLVKIKKQYNVHICTVLHENAGESGKARGHLGTNLKNLCESILKIEVDRNNRSKSIISALAMRGREFDSFAIEIDGQGIPFLSDHTDYTQNKF